MSSREGRYRVVELSRPQGVELGDVARQGEFLDLGDLWPARATVGGVSNEG